MPGIYGCMLDVRFVTCILHLTRFCPGIDPYWLMTYVTQSKKGDELNRIYPEDLPVHEWYRFVLSYPPHLVRDYLERFNVSEDQRVLDPFCGTGTTLVECKKRGIPSVGFESNPPVHFAAQVKTHWDVDPAGLKGHAEEVAEATRALLSEEGVEDDPPLFQPLDSEDPELRTVDPEKKRLLIKNSISPRPLHKVLALQETLAALEDERFKDHERLALAKELVYSISNLRFGPEVGVGQRKEDAPVVRPWVGAVQSMVDDLEEVQDRKDVPAHVRLVDARKVAEELKPHSIDAIITSPPYPNEKDYSRTTRLESVLLGFMQTRKDLRAHKKRLLRSNTRGVYKADRDDEHVQDFPRVIELADRIEQKRKELGKTSGFEKMYHRVVRLYFGGMARHFKELTAVLRPGAKLAYVVGDQASYFRIPIRTGELLEEIAEALGYKSLGRELFRTRFATATQDELREEVLLLEWCP